ncbi:hypothetical protein PROFUN_09305 [Planoprotostelium fungivorum]|uniref:Protein artemis n=1 Tax=Planoprotostelium fungivorum TaxID=1890364 RepID=A0A2P6NHA4_9EUKA|nr:hypothetical protein PROFUN_09305 [Planoprotostelium fungivorum]
MFEGKLSQSSGESISSVPLTLAVDLVYLDATFSSPTFERFMSLEELTKQVMDGTIRLIDKHLREDRNHRFWIGIDTLGKEDLLVRLAIYYDTQIVISKKKMEMIQCMNREDLSPQFFTTTVSPQDSFLFALEKKSVTGKRLAEASEHAPTIGIIPTGWCLDENSWTANKRLDAQGKTLLHYLPYSLHSSHTELIQFMKRLRPRRCIPVSNNPQMHGNTSMCIPVSNNPQMHGNTSMFTRYLNPEEKTFFHPPEDIYAYALGGRMSQLLHQIHPPSQLEPVDRSDSIPIDAMEDDILDFESMNDEELEEKDETQAELIAHYYPQADLSAFSPSMSQSSLSSIRWSKEMMHLLRLGEKERKGVNRVYPQSGPTKTQ